MGLAQKNPDKYFQANSDNKKLGIKSVLELSADGGTNINEAVLKAIEHGKEARIFEDFPENAKTMIVFLTDGEASEGVQNPELIIENIENANKESKIAIMTIGFGAGSDFDLLKKISQTNNGIAKRIYEGADAALQLENFFTKISNPVLSNVKFDYVGAEVEEESLSERQVGTWFKGSEYIIVGQLNDVNKREDDNGLITITIDAKGAEGHYHQSFDICLRSAGIQVNSTFPSCQPTQIYPRSAAQQFLKKLFALRTIKQLEDKIEASDNDDEIEDMKQRALELSLENNFVTDFTSLVVIKPDEEPKINNLEIDLSEIPSPFYSASSRHPITRSKNRYSGSSRPYSSAVPYASGPRITSGSGVLSLSSFPKAPQVYATTTVDYSAFNIAYDYYEYDDILPGPGSTTTTTATTSSTTSTTSTTVTSQCSGNLTLYTKTYLRGEEFETDSDLQDLGAFDDEAVSVKILGDCCWEVFSKKTFQGLSLILKPWETYTSATSLENLLQNVSSVKKLNAC